MGAVKILKKLSVYLFYFKDDLYLDKWHVMLSHLITNGLAPKVVFFPRLSTIWSWFFHVILDFKILSK